jgi:hypothetical protein
MGVRVRRTAFLIATLCPIIAPGHAQTAGRIADPCASSNLKRTVTVAGFVAKTYQSMGEDGAACLQVFQGGRKVYQLSGDSSYEIGQAADAADGIPAIKPGTDLNGNGKPDLIVQSSTGGAHCCYTVRVLELGKKLQVVDKIDAQDGDLSHFEYDKVSHSYLFHAADWTFSYWHTSFAQSPAPKIVLQLSRQGNDGDTRLSLDSMSQPLPRRSELDAESQKVRSSFENPESDAIPASPELWTTMLNLIYTGHSEEAWQFMKDAWPPVNPHKEAFLGAFCEKLSTSPYWGDLKKSMKTTPVGCIAFSE